MKKLLALLLFLPSLALAGDFNKPVERPLTRVAYSRLAGGTYVLRSLPLFDVVPSGGTVSSSGAGGGSSSTFLDTVFTLQDDGDTTKQARFQLSGVTTGTTRTFTLQNADMTLAGINFANTWSSAQTFSANSSLGAAIELGLGAVNNANNSLQFSQTQTPDTGALWTGTTGNSWLIAERQDGAFDFAHAAQTDPTLFIHSHNQTTTEWGSLAADGTWFWFGSGSSRFAFYKSGSSGNARLEIAGNGMVAASDMPYAWSDNLNAGAGTKDLQIRRAGIATLQMGVDVNGAAVNQTFKAHDGITGTDVIGADLTLSSGSGTGTGAGSQVNLSRVIVTTTGTTPQARTSGITVCETKTLSNTTATVTALANITLPSNSAGSVRVTVGVQCNDGTNFDSDIVTSYVAFVNKATVVTVGTPVTTASAGANNSGSCTVAPTFTASGNSININVTPVITTISPTTTTAFLNIENLGGGVVGCN